MLARNILSGLILTSLLLSNYCFAENEFDPLEIASGKDIKSSKKEDNPDKAQPEKLIVTGDYNLPRFTLIFTNPGKKTLTETFEIVYKDVQGSEVGRTTVTVSVSPGQTERRQYIGSPNVTSVDIRPVSGSRKIEKRKQEQFRQQEQPMDSEVKSGEFQDTAGE